MFVRKTIDSTISELEFIANPNIGKYRIEINPISDIPEEFRLCLVMLTKQFVLFNVPVPLTCIRKAILTKDDETAIKKVLYNEFPDDLSYDFHDMNYRRDNPGSVIQTLDFKITSSILFRNEKELDKWIKPINKEIENILSMSSIGRDYLFH